MSCERCLAEAHRRGIFYEDMLKIAERDAYPCTKNNQEGRRLRAGQFWNEAKKCDDRIAHFHSMFK